MADSIDILVVNYRSGDLLVNSLEVGERFGGAGTGLVVVDNSPEDGAVENARRAYPRLTVVSNRENRGFAAAVNQGLQHCTAPIVLLLNPDVSHMDGDITNVYRIFGDDPRVAAVGVRLLNTDGTLQKNARISLTTFDILVDCLGAWSRFPRRSHKSSYGDWGYDTQREVDVIYGAVLALRRAAIDEVGLFDEQFFVYAEETDWLARARTAGWKVVFTPTVQAVHRQRASTDASATILDLLLLESYYSYASKHLGHGRAAVLRASLLTIDATRLAVATARGSNKKELRKMLLHRIKIHLGSSVVPTVTGNR